MASSHHSIWNVLQFVSSDILSIVLQFIFIKCLKICVAIFMVGNVTFIVAKLHLRDGSKPVVNSGQGACADVAAGVSGQHSQPSHVPRQNFPKHKWNWR